MTILIAGDVHVSTNSSIVRRRGERYSERLENCIDSINWVEGQAQENNADLVVYIGDFFDKAELNAEEITALTEISWAPVYHDVLVGNHELGNAAGDYSTAHLLGLMNNFNVVSEPYIKSLINSNVLYLPYLGEEQRDTIENYYRKVNDSKNKIVISHNDIKGINYGAFTSTSGFDLTDIENNCDLFINGHIHNGQKLNSKSRPEIINIGNLTGQNMSEDASKYEHHIMLVDDKDLSIRYVENPYAYNFYKVNVTSAEQVEKLRLKNNAVVSITCPESLHDAVKESLESRRGTGEVDEFRIITQRETSKEELEAVEALPTVDYLEQFKQYIIERVGSDEVTLKELQEVLYAD